MTAIGDGPVAGTLETRSRTTKYAPCFVLLPTFVCASDIHATPRILHETYGFVQHSTVSVTMATCSLTFSL